MEKKEIIKKKDNIKKSIKNINRENVKNVLLKEEMTPKHKYILLTLTSLLIAFVIYVGVNFILANTASFDSVVEEIELNEYIDIKKQNEKNVIYIANRNNEINKDYENIVIEELRKRKTKVKFLDLGPLLETNRIIEFMNADDFTKENYTDPMILVFENGKVKDSLVGTATKSNIEKFLDSNRID